MANYFSGDSDCVALYNFESGSFLSDSIGSNDLTNDGADEETTIYFQGSQSAKFVRANTDKMYVLDGDLDSGFPFKMGESNRDITFFFRVYLSSLPSAVPNYFGAIGFVGANSPISVEINADNKAVVFLNYWAEEYAYGTAFEAEKWYSVAFTYNSSDDSYRIRIYDHSAGDLLDDDLTGTTDDPLVVNGAGEKFYLGSPFYDPEAPDYVLDEVVVFSRVLDTTEIDAIIANTFGLTNYTLEVDSGTFTETGTAANLEYNRHLDVESGSFVWTGSDVEFSGDLTMTAGAGAFAISGAVANLEYNRANFEADGGSFAIAGTAANLERHPKISVDAGSFEVTGSAVTLELVRLISAGAGSFVITGADVSWGWIHSLLCGSGAFALTGASVAFSTIADRWRTMKAASASYESIGAASSSYEKVGAGSSNWETMGNVSSKISQ